VKAMVFPRWRKILRDLWNNKTRTLLVVISIAVGVAAIGMVAGTYAIITRELPGAYARVNPTSANLYTAPFDDALIQVVRNMGIVRAVEGRYAMRANIRTGPDTKSDLFLHVIPNFQNIQINKVSPQSGAWPPEKGEILIERASMPLIKAKVGDTLTVETPDGRQRDLKISGLAHDLNEPAGTFTNRVSGYISLETLELLGYPRLYNELLITVDGNPPDPVKVNKIANQVADKIRKGGLTVFSIVLANPGRLWFVNYVTPMASILGILGVIILLMSGLLVINTISALMAQQIRQIGIMKAVGGTTSQIMAMYLVSMLIIGLAALIIAVPLGNILTRAAVSLLTGIINFDITNYEVPRQILYLQIGLSLLVPVAAASIPIFTGSRITVREAISDYGLTKVKFGDGFFDRLIGSIRGLPRPLLLSLRNTFRQKSRLTLTLITLSIGSAIFIAVLSVYVSLTSTLDQSLRYYGFDVVVQFNHPYRVEQIAGEVKNIPGIVSAETWDASNVRVVLPNGNESDNILLIAPPTNTSLINPTIMQGRWLKPGDQDAIVINSDVLRLVPGIKIGDRITLNIDEKKSDWSVVGIIRSVLNGPTAYANYPYFSRTLGRYGMAGAAYVKVQNEDSRFQKLMAKLLEDHFEKAGIKVGSTSTVADLRVMAVSQYNVIFIFLILMSVLLTVVGGFGLTGTMSLNVLERTREIGVLRAVGASNGAVMQIVILEGILIGVLSWMIGIVLAMPLSWMLGNAVGTGFLREPLRYTYSPGGAILWFFIVLILGTLASYFPARRAVRLTVRDILAYE
jgi:putative ABC transport system permease protein